MDSTRLIKKANGAAVETDLANRLLAWNEAANELLGLDEHGTREGVNVYDAIDARDSFGNRLPKDEVALLNMVQQGEPINGFEITAIDANGERIRISVLPVLAIARERTETRIIYFFRPMYRRRRADEALERILSDPERWLTNLRTVQSRSDLDLTPRQREILTRLAEGLSNAEIARVLGISINTVRTHVQSVLDRLDARSRVAAVAKAFREGLM